MGLVLAWPTTASATMSPSVESPANGQTVGASTFNIHATGTSNTSNRCGFSKAELRLDGVSTPIKTWSWGSGDNHISISETFSYNASRNNSYRIKLRTTEWIRPNAVSACAESGWTESSPNDFIVDAPPATPTWASGYPSPKLVDGAPVITLRWKANSEPDIKQYMIQRTGPGSDVVIGVTPSQAGCGGGWCTIKDDAFAGTGYSGTYSYFVVAYRNSVVSADECGNCIASSPSSTRSTSVKEPPPPPPPSSTGGSGSGGSGSANGGASGGSGSGSNSGSGGSADGGDVAPPPGLGSDGGAAAPVTRGQSLPGGGGGGAEFFQGEYSTRLPYQNRTLLVPGGGQTRTTTRTVASGDTGFTPPPDVMKMLMAIAGGLLFIMLAAHARRMLKDR